MRTIGVVKGMNLSRGMIAIWVEEQGGYTIIEMMSSDIVEIGDVFDWADGYSMGSCAYRNLTKGWVSEVFVQDHDVPPAIVRQQLSA